MFSYGVYKIIHLMGVFMVIIALGGIASHMRQGGTRQNFVWRKKAGMLHGIGLTLALIAGFGLMARKGYSFTLDHWICGKLIIWLIIGAYPMLFYRCKKQSQFLLWGLFAILYIAVLLVNYRYFDWG